MDTVLFVCILGASTTISILFSRGGKIRVRKISREDIFAKFHAQWIFISRDENFAQNPNSRV